MEAGDPKWVGRAVSLLEAVWWNSFPCFSYILEAACSCLLVPHHSDFCFHHPIAFPDPDLFSSVQLLSHTQLFETPWTAACQASLSIISSQSLLKPMSVESVMPSNHLLLIQIPHPLLLLRSIIPSIRVFSNESALPNRWPKYWSFSFSISHFNAYSGLISFKTDLITLQPKGLSISLSLSFFNWRIIALHNFVVFCQTATWISHRYTYIHITPSF